MTEIVTLKGLQSALSKFLDKLIGYLPIKGSADTENTLQTQGSQGQSEVAMGSFNSSSSDTLMSIGNGSSEENRKNAFEVKTDGSIYIEKNGETVKLQDELGYEASPNERVQALGTEE